MSKAKASLLVFVILTTVLGQFVDTAPNNSKSLIKTEDQDVEEPVREEPATTNEAKEETTSKEVKVKTIKEVKVKKTPEVTDSYAPAEPDLAADAEIYSMYKKLMQTYGKRLLENAMHKFFDIA